MVISVILNLFVFLLLCAEVSLAADAPDESLVTRTPDGQVTLRTLRPSGGVVDFLPYAPDEILVRFKDSASPATKAAIHGRFKANTIKRFRHVNGLELVKLHRGASLEKTLKSYRDNRDVFYAEPNYLVEKLSVPNDPSFPLQWNLQNTGQSGGTPGADIKAVQAWDITTGSSNVVVAVIDTGIDYNHQDLAANMWRNEADCNNNGIDDDGNGYIDDCYGIDTFNDDSDPMDDNNHGTHVAGIIGAVGNNSLGVVGVNWNVKIMACKFIGADGFGTTADAIDCLEYVKTMKDRGVNIVATNNSWGAYSYSQALYDAIEIQRQRGILLIVAAGNAGFDNDMTPFYPASYYLPNVVSVAATTRFDCIGFSNLGRRTVHLAAPGHAILSTTAGNTYSTFSGTSMAAPHVAGVTALLKAQDPGRDWRAIKNLILAGGQSVTSPYCRWDIFITKKRLDARRSLTCSNSVVLSRLRPITTVTSPLIDEPIAWHLGEPLALSMLHINCANPNGELNVLIDPGGELITLRDNGIGSDQAPGDGIYSGQWSPSTGGTFTLTFPNGDVVTVKVDPHLKPGFPVKTFHSPGIYSGGPAIHTLVGNMDDDPNLEIVVTALTSGPLYAWKSDGSPVPGWPVSDIFGAAYPAMGELSTASPGLEVFSGHFDVRAKLVGYTGSGDHLLGWPRDSANYTTSPAALADVDGDGLDEIFVEEEDWQLHAYKADGTPLPGWPVWGYGGQSRNTPAIADLDGDGYVEIVTVSGLICGVICEPPLFAYHHDGTPVSGFPVHVVPLGPTFPAIGDVDGDGIPEIVVPAMLPGDTPWEGRPGVVLFAADGGINRAMKSTVSSSSSGGGAALADLDGDGVPEIIFQSNLELNVWRGNGSPFPGWPVTDGIGWQDNSLPVVGDVDGDGLPDIVITTSGEVHAYNRNGSLLSGFPKKLPIGSGAVPAIADIDLDGRNDIIVTGSSWYGVPGDFDKVWVFDLGGPPHGAVQWGQLMGGPKHQGVFKGGFVVPNRSILNVRKTGQGSGTVTTASVGINCGTHCSETYDPSTVVVLTATPAPNSVFAGWSGGGCTGTDPCTVTVTADTIVAASFNLKQFTLTVAKAGTEDGTVFSSPAGITCGGDCSNLYDAGTLVLLWVTAASGSVFAGWSGGGCSGTGNCSLSVTADTTVTATFGPPTPSIDASTLPQGEVNLAYTANLQISGGHPPYTVSVTKGSLPPGLNLGSPAIVGTPTVAGTNRFTITVTDQLGSSASKLFTLQIYPRLKVATLALAAGKVGRVYNKILKAKGGLASYSWSIPSGSLPPGLNLNPSTGQITGTPISAGTFNVTFQVTDPLGGQAQKSFTLKIK